jgi:hypothetical protein
VQAFLQDRYQSMRLHNPLPNRSRASLDDSGGSGFLPPLDAASSSSKPPFSSSFAVRTMSLSLVPPGSLNSALFLTIASTLSPSILQSGKAVGWKAPPEPEKRPAPKEPGIDQVDAAKRLSQGLSVKEVKHSIRQRITAENAIGTRYLAGVVLDRQAAEPAPVRATAVIRQQVFHFDAEHREQMLGLRE